MIRKTAAILCKAGPSEATPIASLDFLSLKLVLLIQPPLSPCCSPMGISQARSNLRSYYFFTDKHVVQRAEQNKALCTRFCPYPFGCDLTHSSCPFLSPCPSCHCSLVLFPSLPHFLVHPAYSQSMSTSNILMAGNYSRFSRFGLLGSPFSKTGVATYGPPWADWGQW